MKAPKNNGSRQLGGLDFTPFSPDLAQVLGSSHAALLMGELERSFKLKRAPGKGWRKGSIYKHVERSTGDPDSLESRTNMGRKAIDTAMSRIAVSYRSPKEYEVFKNAPFTKRLPDRTTVEMPYARVVDPRGRCTRIFRNPARVADILAEAKKEMQQRRGGWESAPDEFPVDRESVEDAQDDALASTVVDQKLAPDDSYDPYEVECPDPPAVRPGPTSSPAYDPYDI